MFPVTPKKQKKAPAVVGRDKLQTRSKRLSILLRAIVIAGLVLLYFVTASFIETNHFPQGMNPMEFVGTYVASLVVPALLYVGFEVTFRRYRNIISVRAVTSPDREPATL